MLDVFFHGMKGVSGDLLLASRLSSMTQNSSHSHYAVTGECADKWVFTCHCRGAHF